MLLYEYLELKNDNLNEIKVYFLHLYSFFGFITALELIRFSQNLEII